MNWIGTNQNICILSFLTIFIQLYTQCRMEGKKLGVGMERNLPDFFPFCPTCHKNFPYKLGVGGGGGEDEKKNSIIYNLL